MPARNSKAVWKGKLQQGEGEIELGSGGYKDVYSFASRFEQGIGTNPEELVADLNLPVKSIHYTNGDLKAETLLSLGVIEHWDDDEDEIAAAQEAGIKANLVPGDVELRETMLSMWANKLQEAGVKVSKKMEKYLKDHPYMEPHRHQD